ncbi:hypothetical protein FTV88_0179 [Heliorestis convoluta]|uniref:Uncharacterized protein n=1 Tax=Heliorestis convoluta TaxID=356322 RepID=A0A5Q2MVW5_9FIRM|nr:hypothetical protein FTV88_0179 [Heliorestis convoluta]
MEYFHDEGKAASATDGGNHDIIVVKIKVNNNSIDILLFF